MVGTEIDNELMISLLRSCLIRNGMHSPPSHNSVTEEMTTPDFDKKKRSSLNPCAGALLYNCRDHCWLPMHGTMPEDHQIVKKW
ncbi:hypothetical protein JTE90_013605 [Oedothorax gibbosus]|uniref:Uncharacterized protein n=1 Tax=Oedothorax gibbosus TaxID=931172 RepID=A0AAV6VGF1_9ARAC|nr:hypothetical protein JTE90_013605 [Oedothorax gibbosus]